MSLSNRQIVELSIYTNKFAKAWSAIGDGNPNDAANITSVLLEELLRDLISENFNRFNAKLKSKILQTEKDANLKRNQELDLGRLLELFRDPRIFDALENITKKSTDKLKASHSTCNSYRKIRNLLSHKVTYFTAEDAIYFLNTIEPFLAFRGVDIAAFRYGKEATPVSFSDKEDCLRILLEKIWKFPETGGISSSWAVKESETIKGNLSLALARPGLGIALFTTELANEVFSDKAIPKICDCVNWGLTQTDKSSPYLLKSIVSDESRGIDIPKPDFRHTIALAILMSRTGIHNHQERYLKTIIKSACDDGGWSHEYGGTKSDLPATVYAVEYLAICSRITKGTSEELLKALQSGQEWLILSANKGWFYDSFTDKSWGKLWITAYILQRLFAAKLPKCSEWSQTLIEATASLLNQVEYKDFKTQFRVKARLAAALSCAKRENDIPILLAEDIDAWLSQWQEEFLNVMKKLPFKECDLATATFAARALLRDKNYRVMGEVVLAEYNYLKK